MSQQLTHRDELPATYKPREVAALFRISLNSVYKLIREGTLPSLRCGSAIRIPSAAVLSRLGGDQ
jgi:excisionase family DNA binding protein